MSDTTAANFLNPEDIEEANDAASAELSRQADEILREGRVLSTDADDLAQGGPTGDARDASSSYSADDVDRGAGAARIREAAREDADAARLWALERGHRVESAIREEPLRATLYALGLGVLIGLLLNR